MPDDVPFSSFKGAVPQFIIHFLRSLVHISLVTFADCTSSIESSSNLLIGNIYEIPNRKFKC